MDPPQDKKRKDPPAVEEEASKKAKSDAEKECRQMSTDVDSVDRRDPGDSTMKTAGRMGW